MSWGLVAVAGATLVGGVMASGASSSAADTQSDAAVRTAEINAAAAERSAEINAAAAERSGAINAAAAERSGRTIQQGTREGIASTQRGLDQSLAYGAQYRDAGGASLEQMQRLSDPSGRANILSDYYGGDEYAQLSAQQEEQALRNASVTGGVRGGNNQVALASIAPQLGQRYLGDLYNQNAAIADLGYGASSQASNAALQTGYNKAQLQYQGAQARGQGYQQAAYATGQGYQQAANYAGQGYQQSAAATGQGYQQAGEASAQNQLAQANIWGDVVGTIGGIGSDYLNKTPPPKVGG